MIPKKIAGKIYGAHLTPDEKKALTIEIQKIYAELNVKNSNEIDATFLWYMHTQFGFGHKRLKLLHRLFRPAINALCERYEMTDDGDELWLSTYKLKEYGIDIEEWNREIREEETKQLVKNRKGLG